MQIWRHVDPKLLGALLVQASRSYAQAKDRQPPASADLATQADRSSD